MASLFLSSNLSFSNIFQIAFLFSFLVVYYTSWQNQRENLFMRMEHEQSNRHDGQ